MKNFFNNLFDSFKDTFSVWNVVKRMGLFLFFGILLSLRNLIINLDNAGQMSSGVWGYITAFSSSVWYGVSMSLVSIWDLIINNSNYIASHSWGSIVFGSIMIIALIGFFYQPVSWVINILDFKGKKETGDDSGQATGVIFRGVITLVVVLILSCVAFYSGASDSLLSGTNNDINSNEDNNTIIEPLNNTETIINSINMLMDGDGT